MLPVTTGDTMSKFRRKLRLKAVLRKGKIVRGESRRRGGSGKKYIWEELASVSWSMIVLEKDEIRSGQRVTPVARRNTHKKCLLR